MEKPKHDLGFEHIVIEEKPKRKRKSKPPRHRRLFWVLPIILLVLGSCAFLLLITPIQPVAVAGRLSNADQSVLIGSARDSIPLGWVDIAPLSQMVSWSPDGELIAVAGREVPVRLYRTDNLEALPLTVQSMVGVHAMAFSKDSQLLAGITFATGEVAVWNTATGKLVASAPYPEDYLPSIAFRPDGKIVAIGWQTHQIFLWDMQSEPQRIGLTDGPEWVGGFAISPDGSLIAGSDDQSYLWLWNAETGLALHRWFAESSNSVSALAFSPDGKVLATGDLDRFVKTWNVERQNNLFGFRAHSDMVTTVVFSPDGQLVASGGGIYDSIVRLWKWDTQTREQYVDVLQGHRIPILNLAFSPDGTRLAVLQQGIPEEKETQQANLWLWDITAVNR